MEVHGSLLHPLAGCRHVNEESNEQIDVFRVFFIFQTLSTIKNEFSLHTWRKYEYFCPWCSWMLSAHRASWSLLEGSSSAWICTPVWGPALTLPSQPGWDIAVPALSPVQSKRPLEILTCPTGQSWELTASCLCNAMVSEASPFSSVSYTWGDHRGFTADSFGVPAHSTWRHRASLTH